MNTFFRAIALLAAMLLAACQTSDVQLEQAGRSKSYITGFHDGRHSGMKEAGNNFEHYIRDAERFASDTEYRDGWLAGEIEGKRFQDQAVAIGNAAAGAYGATRIDKAINDQDPDKVAKDAVKGIDTEALKSLEKE